MRFKQLLRVLIITLVFAANIAMADKPQKCPSVADIQALVVQKSDLIEIQKEKWDCCTANGFPYHVDGVWETREFHNQFGTKNEWSMKWYSINANTAEEALLHVTKTLATLTFVAGPKNEFGHYYCSYRSVARAIDIWYVR